MKKLLLLSLLLILNSCLAVRAPSVKIGMTVDDFIKAAKWEEIVSMEDDITIYRVQYGLAGEYKLFYYFKDNKLFKMDQGVDKKIEVDGDIKVDID